MKQQQLVKICFSTLSQQNGAVGDLQALRDNEAKFMTELAKAYTRDNNFWGNLMKRD